MPKQKGGAGINGPNGSSANTVVPLAAAVVGAAGPGVANAAAAATAVAIADPITHAVQWLSMNPWLAGICYVVLNLAGKHIAMNLTPEQEKLLGSVWLRPVIIFCLCFVATRNLVTAFWLTIMFMIVFYVILYEGSPFCLFRVLPVEKPQPQPQPSQPSQPSQPPVGPNGMQLSMIPLFARGPIAVPDHTLLTEETTYLQNIQSI